MGRPLLKTVYGMLTVGAPTGERTSAGEMIYRCTCQCGGSTETTLRRLRDSGRKSCGCLVRERHALKPLPVRKFWAVRGRKVALADIAAVLGREPQALATYLTQCVTNGMTVDAAVLTLVR